VTLNDDKFLLFFTEGICKEFVNPPTVPSLLSNKHLWQFCSSFLFQSIALTEMLWEA